MQRRIAWLTAAATSAVVLAFVVPLCLLVRTMATDRGLASADAEARNSAIIVSGLAHDPQVGRLLRAVDERSPSVTTVLAPDGTVLGTGRPGGAILRDTEVARARRGQAFTVVDARGARVLVPVVTEAGTYVVRTSLSESLLHRGVRRAWASIVVLGLALLLTAVLLANRIGKRIATPVTDLASVAHQLREGRLDTRAEPAGTPETVELGHALNRLAERISDLLAAERAAVGDLSHRLRTPLTALRLDAEAVSETELTDRLLRHIAQLQVTVDSIVKDARRPIRADMGARCDAVGVVRHRVAFWSALAADQDRTCDFHGPTDALPVAIDASSLQDVVDVLVDNVFAHTPEGTSFAIRLERDGGRAHLVVSDTGPGAALDAAHEERRVGSTGLGLQLVRRTVTDVGGEMRMVSAATGTRVDVWIPLVRDGAGPGDGQSSSG